MTRLFSRTGIAGALLTCLLAGPAAASWLGVVVQPADRDLVDALNLGVEHGVLVSEVVPDSPADDAGVVAGDVILTIDGDEMRGVDAFAREIRRYDDGDTVDIELVRDGRVQTLSAVLGESPSRARGGVRERLITPPTPPRAPSETRSPREPRELHELHERHGSDTLQFFGHDFDSSLGELRPHLERLGHFFSRPRLGIEMRDLDSDLASYFETEAGEGVLVLEVMKDTVAEEVGIRAGDVIVSLDGRSVGSAAELREALLEYEGEDVTIELRRHGRLKALTATLEKPRSRKLSFDRIARGGGEDVEEKLDSLRDELDELRLELRKMRRGTDESR